MSIIQQIREKYAALGIGFIALSLIGFILMDTGGGAGGGGIDPKDAIGEVNGNSMSYLDFTSKTRRIEEAQQSSGRNVDENMRQQINADVWRTLVEKTLMDEQYDNLGLVITDKEFNDLLFGENPADFLRQEFTDPNTGQFDAAAAKQAIAQLKKNKSNPNTAMIEEFYLDPLVDNTLRQKYFSLLQKSAYVPKFYVEKMMADNGSVASFSFVQVPYTSIADSTAVVSDDMVKKYISSRAKEFKQEEATRSIAYVSFPYNASAEDSASAYKELIDLKVEFANAEDPGSFAIRNASTLPFSDTYFSKSRIQIADKDSIIGAGLGNVYGPYLDGNSYVMSRVIDVKTLPDSVKARHILIGTVDPRTQQPLMEDSTAKAKIDSIERAVKGGAAFASLAGQFSTDEGSAARGGDLGYFASGQMVKEFNDFCFEKPKGSIGVVRSQFGYHLIEITDQKNFEPGYKIAYLARTIDPSMETVNDALNAANLLAGNSRSVKAFDENVVKQGLNKLLASDIKENDYMVMGLGVNRRLVRDIFESDPGKVLDPVEIDNQYVVVAITGAEKSGTMSVQKARPMVESILRNQVKAKIIKEKIGTPASLEAVATANNTIVQQADSISFVSPMIPAVGFEPAVGAFAFAKNNLNKVSNPIGGNSGVFVIQTKAVGAQATLGTTSEDLRSTLLGQQRNLAASGSMQALREKADIKDKRSKFL